MVVREQLGQGEVSQKWIKAPYNPNIQEFVIGSISI